MGFHTGIIVYRRVTDESKWKEFLQVLYNKYKDSSQVKLRVNYDAEQDKFKPLHEPVGDLRAVRLCEQFNFPSESLCMWMTHSKFELRQTSENSWSSSSEDWAIAEKKTIALLRDEAEKLHYSIDDKQLIEWARTGVEPPVAMEFETGEYPAIALYGHHFKGCITKIISRDPTPTEKIIDDIYMIFSRFFPDHAYLWNELRDQWTGASDRYYVPGSRYRTCVSNEKDEDLERFYNQLFQEYQQ